MMCVGVWGLTKNIRGVFCRGELRSPDNTVQIQTGERSSPLRIESQSFSLRKGRKSDVITFLMLFDRRYPVLNDRRGGTKPRYQGVLLSFSQKGAKTMALCDDTKFSFSLLPFFFRKRKEVTWRRTR